MSQSFPEPAAEVESIAPEDLKRRIDAGREVFLLDTRASREFEEWHIDGPSVEVANVPYFEFLTGEVGDDALEPIPGDRGVVVLCAKGEASRYVAGELDERGYETTHLASGMNGWASIYESRELDAGTDATVVQYARPSSGCLAYLIADGDEAAVIDPLRAFVDEYVRDARALGAGIEYAIDTHVHADHVSGVRALAAETGAEPIVPAPAAARGIDYDVDHAAVEDGDALSVGEAAIEVHHTPGHTTGMTAYAIDGVLFTGDGLFVESVARPDLEEGDEGAPDAARRLHETLQARVLSRPDETLIAPGHFSDAATPNADGTFTARLGDLRESMDALSMDREAFVEFVLDDMPPRPANYEEIIATNLGRRAADDDEAFRLELGPNNCAASRDALTGE